MPEILLSSIFSYGGKMKLHFLPSSKNSEIILCENLDFSQDYFVLLRIYPNSTFEEEEGSINI